MYTLVFNSKRYRVLSLKIDASSHSIAKFHIKCLSFAITSQAPLFYLQSLLRANLFLGYSFAHFHLYLFQRPIILVPPELPFPIIIFAIDYLILSCYLADFTPISYSTAQVRNPTIGAEDVTDMTSFVENERK